LQEMLYQHLPEPMRNKETFNWMLSNPEYRKQLAQTLKAQARPALPNLHSHSLIPLAPSWHRSACQSLLLHCEQQRRYATV